MHFRSLLIVLSTLASQVSAPLRAEDAKPAPSGPRGQGSAARRMLNPEDQLKVLTEKLSLTPEQQEKVKAVYARTVEKLKAMRGDKALSEDARRQQFTEMRRAEFQEIQAILTPEQQEKMKALARERAGATRGRVGEAAAKPPAK